MSAEKIKIGTARDEKKAFEWFLKSAENGYYKGQFEVGLCYGNGIGTPSNCEKVNEWLQKMKSNRDQK
ncbi:11208_t:CDS:2 [Scutellospora calospora]|uniref:11208_t:CDS:1 n=1 Tax=Scutellospora calospora TaxID=85575 RepID=A0ACA9KJE1_9GLOM|nr:11208_t:CDS:2 [Scutellospora calospora]